MSKHVSLLLGSSTEPPSIFVLERQKEVHRRRERSPQRERLVQRGTAPLLGVACGTRKAAMHEPLPGPPVRWRSAHRRAVRDQGISEYPVFVTQNSLALLLPCWQPKSVRHTHRHRCLFERRAHGLAHVSCIRAHSQE